MVSSRWVRQFKCPPGLANTLYVTTYGAACDGSTVDTIYIQNTIDAAGPGDSVVFPSGTCVYDDNLNINGKSTIWLVGSGMNSTILKAIDPAHSAIRITNSSGISIHDLEIWSANSTGRSGDDAHAGGVWVSNGYNVNFSGIRVHYTSAAGIVIEGSQNVGVYDSEFIDTWADGVHVAGRNVGANVSVTIQNNYAWGTGDDSFSCVGYTDLNQYVGFYNNESHLSGASGITVEACQYVEVFNNSIADSMQPGVRVGTSDYWESWFTSDVDVRWNELYRNGYGSSGKGAVHVFTEGVYNVTYIHVRDNYIEDPYQGIAVSFSGGGGGYVHDSQNQNNTISGSGVACSSIVGSVTTITVSGNSGCV